MDTSESSSAGGTAAGASVGGSTSATPTPTSVSAAISLRPADSPVPVPVPVTAPIGPRTGLTRADDDDALKEFRTPFAGLSEIQRAYLEGKPFGVAADEDPATAVPGDKPGDAVKSAQVKAELQSKDSRPSAANDRLTARPGTAGTPQK